MGKWQFPILLFLLTIQWVTAQSGIQHWDTEDGLSNNWVSQIIQDDEGYIWIATQYGLNRFDGYSFRSFIYRPNEPNSLKANWVRTVSKDSTGQLWLGSFYGGISAFQPKIGQIQHYDSQASVVLSMLCDEENAIWVSSRRGLFVKRAHEDNFQQLFKTNIG